MKYNDKEMLCHITVIVIYNTHDAHVRRFEANGLRSMHQIVKDKKRLLIELMKKFRFCML